ncbi:2-phospho-L-lactate guanylyltransferase [Rubrobacter aplysinae]|uniref:2-phospho-L-lactate guanylyltransferase n=1 Tax=Rubrobacter aplysinae TaxID=909625 RepID=UPI00069D9D0B|nr:2-phospho-L-lactate guanylyltransferase [Rubrobacter aplysinae]
MSAGRELERTFAAVPVKDLLGTKSRLAPALGPGSRAGLTLYMMKHVVSVLRLAGIPPANLCVVSPDKLVLETAAEAGAVPLPQSTSGLNPALEEAREWALSRGAASLLVLPADLPLIRTDDVESVLQAGEETPVTLAPDAARSGTNALLLEPPDAIPFLFGSGSRRAHLDAARRRGLGAGECPLPNLSFDIDTVGDLSQFDVPEELRVPDGPSGIDSVFSRGKGRA